jgi:hypothetical protein
MLDRPGSPALDAVSDEAFQFKVVQLRNGAELVEQEPEGY